MAKEPAFTDFYPAGDTSPWTAFLFARMRALAAMRADGNSVDDMVHALSVDRGQVHLLLMTWDDAKAKKDRAARDGEGAK